MNNPFGLLLIGAAAFLGYKSITKKSSAIPPEDSSNSLPQLPTQPTATLPSATVVNAFPLQLGSRGELVKTLQKALQVSADGVFGEKTQAALVLNYALEKVTDAATLQRIVLGKQPLTTTGSATNVVPSQQQQYPIGQMMLAMYRKVTNKGKTYWIERGLYDNGTILSLLEIRVGSTTQDRPVTYLRGLKKAFDSYYTKQPFLTSTKDVKLADSLAQSSNAKVQRFAKIMANL